MADDNKKNTDKDESDYITLEYDDGTVIETEIMGTFELGGREYIALVPDDDTDDVYIYGYQELDADGTDFELIDITSDEEFKNAVAAFEEIVYGEE